MERFPEGFASWLGLVVQTVTVSLAVAAWVIRFIRHPLMEQVNGLGGRVKKTEETAAQQAGKIESLERSDERTNFQIAAMAERAGRIEGHQEKLDGWLEAFEQRTSDINTQTQSRLAGIEAKIDLILKSMRSE